MHGREKSDSAIVAGKPTNKAVPTAAEPVERRAGAKGNASQQSTHRTQRRVRVSQALERVRQVSPSHTQGGSRVREFRSHGSGRGAVSNGRPYRTSLRILDPTETLAAKFAVMHDAINSASRPSSEWNDDDYDVLADGVVGGRIFKAKASPVGTPWMWT